MKKSILDLYTGGPPSTPKPKRPKSIARPTQKTLDVFDISTDTYENLPLGNAVPNKFPRSGNFPYRLAIVGEAPGADEERIGEPFVGASGRFLTALLSRAGIVRDACFIGNICQFRPPNNEIDLFSRDGPEIQNGLDQLQSDLREFDPNVCLLLGRSALWAANGEDTIGNWRGSLFTSSRMGPFLGRKCIAAYHPAACLRQYEWTPVLSFDIRKALAEAGTKELVLPQRRLVTDMSVDAIVDELERINLECPRIAIDIEGYVYNMSCISVAPSPDYAFIVPIARRNGENIWLNPEDEFRIWRALARVLTNPRVKKILQNSLYDRFVLQYTYGVPVFGVEDDTMLKHWELYCELEKSLAFMASIYTKEPYYKADRKSEDRKVFHEYCCRDSAVTYEIHNRLERILDPTQQSHYNFNVSMLNPMLYMELRGINYDSATAARRLHEVEDHVYALQYDLDQACGAGIKSPIDKATLLQIARDKMCYKRDHNIIKKEFLDVYPLVVKLLSSPDPLTKRDLGWFNTVCEIGMNIKSPKFKTFLYETLQLPPQFAVDPKTKEKKLSADYLALLNLSKKTNHPSIGLALEVGNLRTRAQMLAIHADPDGRIRCGYNVVGTETGRITCYTSPTGSGYNLQTIPAEDYLKPEGHPMRYGMRDLFIADEGCWMFQCDLSGADGWTVAAHLAALGDPTMLDDYKNGVRPAKVLCYMLRHGSTGLHGKCRAEIKDLCKEVGKESWDYFACKIGQHGTSYGMGPETLVKKILKESEGRVNLSTAEGRDLQRLFQIRYRVKLWHNATEARLSRKAELMSASGHRRRFFGRPSEILNQALADEPQQNTTYATNRAVLRAWNDPENRREDHSHHVESLHQVHDAWVGQFRKERTEWSLQKISTWFNNPMYIAGIKLVIPFEGTYGTNWAFNAQSKVGDF